MPTFRIPFRLPLRIWLLAGLLPVLVLFRTHRVISILDFQEPTDYPEQPPSQFHSQQRYDTSPSQSPSQPPTPSPSSFELPPIRDLTNRTQRFPTVEERVKLYMSNWYHPPCKDAEIGIPRYRIDTHQPDPNRSLYFPTVTVWNPWEPQSDTTVVFDSVIKPDVRFMFERSSLNDCGRPLDRYTPNGPLEPNGTLPTEIRINNRINMRTYCSEVVQLVDMVEALDAASPNDPSTPILGQFGDNIGFTDVFPVPLFTKFRWAATPENLDKVTGPVLAEGGNGELCLRGMRPSLEREPEQGTELMPIIWKLSTHRHWHPLTEARQIDIPWSKKKLGALWRGDLTGRLTGNSDGEKCRSNPRCSFVLRHAGSELIDAGFSSHGNRMGDVVDGIQLVKDRVKMTAIVQYKVIISIEGNDVASGLKWSLLSQSVVLMPPPTRTSWAMEELLEPWVHYIPMEPDGSNAEEMVQWVKDNDEQAQLIAQRGTLFIYDMIYHRDAEKDDIAVKEEMARRYRALWH